MWLKADAITGLNDGEAIATWEDSSAANNDATQSNASLRPTYQTNELNGLPSVQFVSTGGHGFTTPLSLSNPFSIIYVGNCFSSSGSRRAVQGSNNWLLGPFTNAWQWFSGGFATTVGHVVSNVYVIHGARQDATSGIHFLQPINTHTPNPVSYSQSSPGDIGTVFLSGGGGFTGEPMGGHIAEVMCFDRKLADEELEGLLLYLLYKYF